MKLKLFKGFIDARRENGKGEKEIKISKKKKKKKNLN